MRLVTLRQRVEFKRIAAYGRKVVTPHVIVQGIPASDKGRGGLPIATAPTAHGKTKALFRVGFTCSKKLGNAVVRNRAKRRLRAAMVDVLTHKAPMVAGECVLIGRYQRTVHCPFSVLTSDTTKALEQIGLLCASSVPPRRQ